MVRPGLWLSVAVLLAVFGFVAPVAASDAVTVVPRSDRADSRYYNELYGVDVISPHEAFSVGVGGPELDVASRRWDGQRWRATHPPGGRFSELYDVKAITPTGVWGVGLKGNRAFADIWDGAAWSRVPMPEPEQEGAVDRPDGVDGVAVDDVWAVGGTSDGKTVPLVEHWDGASWTRFQVDLPYGNASGSLEDVVAISTDDVWAVGNTSEPVTAALLLHWDGFKWTANTDVLDPDNHVNGVLAVDAIASDDVWAVGGDRNGGTGTLHWNGSTWVAVHSPGQDRFYDYLYGVAAIASDDVWAVGGSGGDTDPDHTRVAHWDGTSWKAVRSPNPGTRNNVLWAVAASGPDDAWAVGSFDNGGRAKSHLYLHWDGERWTRVRPNGT